MPCSFYWSENSAVHSGELGKMVLIWIIYVQTLVKAPVFTGSGDTRAFMIELYAVGYLLNGPGSP